MARAPYILARTLKEAHEFAREELGLGRGQYRPVHSPSTISSVRGVDLHLVPGYEKRVDRFAMKGALRYTRLNIIEHTPAKAPPVLDGLNPPGEQLELVSPEEATAFFDVAPSDPLADLEAAKAIMEKAPPPPPPVAFIVRPVPDDTEPPQSHLDMIARVLPDKVQENAEEPEPEVKRRRRRCTECGILVDPDEVEQHKSEHLPTDS